MILDSKGGTTNMVSRDDLVITLCLSLKYLHLVLYLSWFSIYVLHGKFSVLFKYGLDFFVYKLESHGKFSVLFKKRLVTWYICLAWQDHVCSVCAFLMYYA